MLKHTQTLNVNQNTNVRVADLRLRSEKAEHWFSDPRVAKIEFTKRILLHIQPCQDQVTDIKDDSFLSICTIRFVQKPVTTSKLILYFGTCYLENGYCS